MVGVKPISLKIKYSCSSKKLSMPTVVALPLALAFGITAGLGAKAGLVTAIVAGLVAAIFGGSSVQVSGPTGAMTVVLVPLVARHGPDAVLVVGLLAGAVIVAAAVNVAVSLGK